MPAIKKTKSSVATNFYLHCNIILCGPEGSKRGGGEEGRGDGKGGVKGVGRGDGGEGYTQQVSSKTTRSTYRAVLKNNVLLHIQVHVRTLVIKKLLTHNHINM